VHEHLSPLAAELHSEIEAHLLAVDAPADGHLLHLRLERDGRVKGLGVTAGRLVFRELGGVHMDFGEDRPARVIPLEFARLPLLREHPERVTHLRLQGALEVVRLRSALQAIPRGNCRD
jgi:hypothetical protein